MNLKALLSQSVLRITGEIDAKAYGRFMDEVPPLAHDGSAITVVINSSGGLLNYGMAMHDVLGGLHEDGIDVSLLAMGECMSSAASILMAVPLDHRYGTKTTQFMVHAAIHGTTRLEPQPPNRPTVKVANDLRGAYHNQERFIVNLLTGGTNRSEAEIREMLTTDTYFTANQALEWGFIGHVL